MSPRRAAPAPHPRAATGARRALVAVLAALGALLAGPAVAGAVVTTELVDPTPGAVPSALAPAADGALWATDPGSGRIVRVSATNVLQGFDANVPATSTGPAPALTPDRIAVGPDGALWYSIREGGIARMTQTGVVTRYNVFRQGRASGIVAGPDGAVWFTLPDTGQIGRITAPTDAEFAGGSPRGAVSTFPVGEGSRPDDIELGADGALWYTLPGADAIGRAVPGAQAPTLSTIALPTPGGAPSRLTTGPDGRIWFSAPGTGRIGRIGGNGLVVEMPLPAGYGAPGDVASGPDGGLWFVETGAAPNALGRINDAGEVTRTVLPDPQGAPVELVRGTDGNLRYTRAGARFGRVDVLASPALQPPPQEAPRALVPVAGRSVILEPVSGTIRIRRPGARGYEPLPAEGSSLPDGTEIDATKGRVRLTAETSPGSGVTRTAIFWDGRFVVQQARIPGAFTEVRLTGRLACGANVPQASPPGDRATVRAAKKTSKKKKKKKKPKVGRRLWGDGKGDFRTRGSRATASVRGTRWLVEDRCDRTTRVRVFEGVVNVRDRIRSRRVTLVEGQEYVAPGARRRR